jgi:hypothetical protein
VSAGAIRAALAVFDDAALETMANKGIVRRAVKDVDAGKVAITEETDARIVATADGETVEIAASGPRTAHCSCPAPGICRHKIAVVLAARGTGAPSADTVAVEARLNTEPARHGPLADILALDSAAIAKWAGKPNLRAAAEILAEITAPEIWQDGATLIIRLSHDEPEVRYLAGQGLDGMVSKATKARLKSLHAAAVLAVRRAHGMEETTAVSEHTRPPAEEMPDVAFLKEVRRALEDAAFTALNQAPAVLDERLFSLSISSRADALPRLGRQLRQLAAAIRQKRERAFAFSPQDTLSLLAGTHALAEALSRSQPPEHLGVLKGAVRQDYEPAGGLTLYGLGALSWETRAGARGVTGYFYALEQQRILTATLARSNERDPSFHPAQAYDREQLWRAAPLRQLVRAKVGLTGASVSTDGRISLGETAPATVVPWVLSRELCSAWPTMFSDWAILLNALQSRFASRLSSPAAGAMPILLAPALHAKAIFDPVAQRYTWGLADAAGRWIGLSLHHDEERSVVAARLQRISELGDVLLILAEAQPIGSRFVLQPIAAIARMPSGGKPELLNLDLESRGTELPSGGMRADWLSLLARKPEGAPPVLVTLTSAPDISAASRLLAECEEIVLTMAELGAAHRAPELRSRVDAFGHRLEAAGLLPLADAVGGMAQSSNGVTADALLRTVCILDRIRAHDRQLPWLQRASG